MNKQQILEKIENIIDYCKTCNTEILNYSIDEEGILFIIEELTQIKNAIRSASHVENS